VVLVTGQPVIRSTGLNFSGLSELAQDWLWRNPVAPTITNSSTPQNREAELERQRRANEWAEQEQRRQRQEAR
jgi:hypothetical protein